MSALAALLLMIAGAFGWGGLALRLPGTGQGLPDRERPAWAFALGMGMLGWLAFWPPLLGSVAPSSFALVAAAGLPGLWTLRPIPRPLAEEPATAWTWALGLAAAFLMACDLAEGLAPPSDADSLAYHFAIPAQMLAEGGLVFVPRAADGAIPLLQQMTYLAALSMGGERAMTLWCMASGWVAPLLAYAIARRWLPRDWALALGVAMLSLPAQLYGAGTGQVEARLAAFTLVAAAAVASSRGKGGLGLAAVAGLAAGFAMASKYPGLLLAFLCGLAFLVQKRGLAKAACFSALALAAGAQWYWWNWANTGDPFFPMLYGLVPYHADVPWNQTAQEAFRRWAAAVEAPLPRGIAEFLSYPLAATLWPHPAMDSGRTGLGPLPLLLAPFALAAAWKRRGRPAASPLAVFVAVALGFYLLWFFFGASQRVRHYLPVMPLLLIALVVAAERWRESGAARRAVASALAGAIVVQVLGQAAFVRPFAQRILEGEGREAFLVRTVPLGFAPLAANHVLPEGAKVLTDQRQWLYLLERPHWFVTPNQQALVDPSAGPNDLLAALRRIGITHVLGAEGAFAPADALIARGCAEATRTFEGPAPAASRTLGGSRGTARVTLLTLAPGGCPGE